MAKIIFPKDVLQLILAKLDQTKTIHELKKRLDYIEAVLEKNDCMIITCCIPNCENTGMLISGLPSGLTKCDDCRDYACDEHHNDCYTCICYNCKI